MIPARRRFAARPRAQIVEVGWVHEDEDGEEQDFRVVLSRVPGSPGRTYGRPEDCYPADPPEIEILEVREDNGSDTLRPDLLSAAEEDFDRLSDKANDAAGEDDYCGPDTIEEWRGER